MVLKCLFTDFLLVVRGKLYNGEIDKVIKPAITNEGHRCQIPLNVTDVLRGTKHHLYSILSRNIRHECYYRRTLDRVKMRNILFGVKQQRLHSFKMPMSLKKKKKEGWGIVPDWKRLKEIERILQLNAVCDPKLDHVLEGEKIYKGHYKLEKKRAN